MLDLNDFKNVVDYTSDAVLIAKPILSESGQLCDFLIDYVNNACGKTVQNKLKNDNSFTQSMKSISPTIEWNDIAEAAFTTGSSDEICFFSQTLDSWFTLNAVKIPGDFLLVTLHDISKDKEQEQQLRRQNLRLAAVSEELILSRQNLKNKLDKIENLNTKLEHIAYHDVLTDLPNRTFFNSILEKEIEKARGFKNKLAVILFDIDNMKNINDSHGHTAGDEYLCMAGRTLKRFERDTIKVFRFGGDEFLVLVTGLESKDTMITISDAMQESLHSSNISISGGISLFPDDTEKVDELLKYADMAMHDVKKKGKNDIFFFQQLMQDKFLTRLNLETKLSTAMNTDSFQLHFQPQVDIKSKKLRGFEALLRWYDDDLGWISPAQFIPLAEESRLVIPLGDWVLETACATAARWRDEFGFDGIMAINVSPVQLKKPLFLYDLCEVMKRYNICPQNIEIEITEGVLIENLEEAVDILQQIKQLGVGISLDDFGTGYSSLSYLQILPLTTLKIDKSFIENITTKNSAEADIIDAIITLVTKMGLDTIAEGVENEEQLEVLKQFQCRHIQGFLMGKPMPADVCDLMLSGCEDAISCMGGGVSQSNRYSIQ